MDPGLLFRLNVEQGTFDWKTPCQHDDDHCDCWCTSPLKTVCDNCELDLTWTDQPVSDELDFRLDFQAIHAQCPCGHFYLIGPQDGWPMLGICVTTKPIFQ
jgi:hypothetical protein